MKFDHQNHSITSSDQNSELNIPEGLALKGVADGIPDRSLLFDDLDSGEEYLVTEQEPAPVEAAPSALTGPEATYALLNALQLNGERNYHNGPALILSAGGGRLAVQMAERWKSATVVFADEAKMDAAVLKPLGSNNAIDKYFSEPQRDPAILRNVEMKVGIDYRWSALDQTGLQSGSFSCALIEQGHNAKFGDVLAEAYRLVRPGGLIILLGYGPFQAIAKAKPGTDRVAVKAFNIEVAEWLQSYFIGLLSDYERTLFSAYKGIDFPFEEVWAPATRSKNMSHEEPNMRATWNLHEVIDHINAWPVVKRIEAAASPDIIDLMNFRKALQKAWGSPKKRRVIVWPVVMRIGRKGSGVVAEHAVEPVAANCTVTNA